MKKYLALSVFFYMALLMTSFTESSKVSAADPTPTPVVDDVVPAPVDDVVPEVKEEKISSGWSHVIGEYSEMLINILGPVFLLLLTFLITKIKEKFGVEVAAITDSLLTSAVKKAINHADAWAAKEAGKPSGDKKMQVALDFLVPYIKKYNLPTIAKDKLIELIEGQLKRDKK